jgi:hypothetical protein
LLGLVGGRHFSRRTRKKRVGFSPARGYLQDNHNRQVTWLPNAPRCIASSLAIILRCPLGFPMAHHTRASYSTLSISPEPVSVRPFTAMNLPALPPHPPNSPWSPNVSYAYQIVSDIFKAASLVLTREADSARLRHHAEAVAGQLVPLLIEMEKHAAEESIPRRWINECARAAAALEVKLLRASESSKAK